MTSPEFDGSPEQRAEWRRQELARQAERHTDGSSARVRRETGLTEYRLIDRALRDERDELPDDFAAQTAALVTAASREASDRLESWLQRASLGVLAISAIASLFVMGWPTLAAVAFAPATGWVCTVALCVGLTLGLQHLLSARSESSPSSRPTTG
jgi:hypothetical protein